MKGHQAKFSDSKNHGLEINPKVMLTLKKVKKESDKVGKDDCKQFLKSIGATESVTIISTNKSFDAYENHKQKGKKGKKEDWPNKVLIVCNQNLTTALPRSFLYFGVYEKVPEQMQ